MYRKSAESALRPWLIHRRTQLLCDAVADGAALIGAYLLRFDSAVFAYNRDSILFWASIVSVLYVAILRAFGGRSTWQFSGLCDFTELPLRSSPALRLLLLTRALGAKGFGMPISICLIWFGLAIRLSSSLRIVRHLIILDQDETRSSSCERDRLAGSSAIGRIRRVRA